MSRIHLQRAKDIVWKDLKLAEPDDKSPRRQGAVRDSKENLTLHPGCFC